MAPTKSNRKAGAKPAPLRKSTRQKAGAKPLPIPNDKENRPAGTNGRESLLQEAVTDDAHEQNWWAINVEKAAALIERCMKEHGWDRAETKRIFAAYRQFLVVKKEHEDWDEEKLLPCWPVDMMWLEHSKMDDYSTDMRDLLGRVLSIGSRDCDGDELKRVDAVTREALTERFGSYDAELWDLISIDVRDQLGEGFSVDRLNRREPLETSLVETYCKGLEAEDTDMTENDFEKLQFVFNGKALKRDDAFIRLGLEDGDEVEVNHPDKVGVTIRYSSENEHLVLADKTTMISKAFERCDVDFGEERAKNVFLYGQRRIYGFESPLALGMDSRGNVIDVVDIESHKSQKCVCCNPDGDTGATGDSPDEH